MSGKESKKKGKLVTEKRSVPNLDCSKGIDHPCSKRRSKRFHKYQTPCFGAVSKGLETDPPGFPDLDLVPFDDRTIAKGKGDASAGSSESREGPSSPRPEFKMTREDFPALPGTGEESADFDPCSAGDELFERRTEGRDNFRVGSKPDGTVTDVPQSMLKDQYGVAGLLSFLRAAERDETLRIRGFGEDLTGYGFDLNSKNFLHPDFYGPYADRPTRPQDVYYDVPKEYLHHRKTKKKLPPVDFSRYDEDTLFYLFYTFVGDNKQLLAAAYLYDKDWRFHTEENSWMTLISNEKNCYFFFDPAKWCKIRVVNYEMEVDKLAERPRVQETNPVVPQPERTARFRPFLSPTNVSAKPSRNSRSVRNPVSAQAESRRGKCVRPIFAQYVPVEVERILPGRGFPTFFAPRLPVPPPSGPFPILDPYAGYRYACQRNVRTLYAPSPPCFPDPENDGGRVRRKKRY